MAIAFEVEEHVDRSPEVVWDRLTDWNAAPEWMKGIDSMESAGPLAVGTTLVFRARGRTHPSEITSLVPSREVTLTSRQGAVVASYTYRCEPQREGTRLNLVADCTIRGPLRVAGPLLRMAMKRTDGGQLAALKRLIEIG